MVSSNSVLNHMLVPWVSEVTYYCDYLEFGNICMFLTSFILFGICFGVTPHHMPDHVVTLAWHTRPHRIRSQIRELTCEAWHVYIWRGLRANVRIFLGMDFWSISRLYITLRFDTCIKNLNICRMHF